MLDFSNIEDLAKKVYWLILLIMPGTLLVMFEYRGKVLQFDGLNFIFISFFISGVFLILSVLGGLVAYITLYIISKLLNLLKFNGLLSILGTRPNELSMESSVAFTVKNLSVYVSLILSALVVMLYSVNLNFVVDDVMRGKFGSQTFAQKLLTCCVWAFMFGAAAMFAHVLKFYDKKRNHNKIKGKNLKRSDD